MKNKRNTRRGFTLIELLVVVLIIGILAAVAVPQYQKAVEKTRLAEALNNIPIIMREYETYALANGYVHNVEYPEIASVELPGITIKKNEHTTGYTMYSKYFEYWAAMTNNYYGVTLYRYQGPITNSEYIYALDVTHYSNGTDDKICYTSLTDIGRYICKSIENQGWEYVDSEY